MSVSPNVATAALRAVAEACEVARAVQNSIDGNRQLAKHDASPVTVADFAAQAVVALRLQEVTGQLVMVGEENSAALREAAQGPLLERVVGAVRRVCPAIDADATLAAIDLGGHDASAHAYWTLDPVDGTKGFLRGGQYAISLAYIEAGEVVFGVLGCPNLSADFARAFTDPDPTGCVFHAARGGGAWQLSARAIDGPGDRLAVTRGGAIAALRMCESVEAEHSRQDEAAAVAALIGARGMPARLDSQCKYAVVARGQADAYLRLPTRADYVEKIWDHAAGKLVAEEAGATVTDIDGRRLDFSRGATLKANRGVVCASPDFHPRLLDAIARVIG